MGPIVNRDLTRRIRTVNGITVHKQVAQNDLRLAARLVHIYDKKYGLYQNESSAANGDRKSFDDPFPGGSMVKLFFSWSMLKVFCN